jgi:hypothetical protein
MLKLLSNLAVIGGGGMVLVALLTGIVLPAAYGKDVILISPHAPDVVELNKLSWKKGDKVVDIYGIQNGEKIRVLFTDPARIIVPEEDPSLTFYKVNKQAGENPLQAQSVAFLSKWLALGAFGVAIAGLILRVALRRKTAGSAPEQQITPGS